MKDLFLTRKDSVDNVLMKTDLKNKRYQTAALKGREADLYCKSQKNSRIGSSVTSAGKIWVELKMGEMIESLH